jgi:hypothetical protein
VYHVELRQGVNKLHRFNLSEQQLWALLVPWARERVVDVGERRWNPDQATVTVFEGPQLDIRQLSMGRGWRSAQREGTDVTAQVMDAARRAPSASSEQHASQGPGSASAAGEQALPADVAPAPDPLAIGVQLASLLGDRAGELLSAWREVCSEHPTLAPSESLAIAERRTSDSGHVS